MCLAVPLTFFLDARIDAFLTGHALAFEAFGAVPRVILYDYVPGNVIVVKCPTSLCAGPPRNPFSPRRFGHISIRAMKAIRGVLARSAK